LIEMIIRLVDANSADNVGRVSLQGVIHSDDLSGALQSIQPLDQLLDAFVDQMLKVQDSRAGKIGLDWLSSPSMDVMLFGGEKGFLAIVRIVSLMNVG
jgi:hypothetical protein